MPIPDVRDYLTTPTDGGGAGGSTLYNPIIDPGNGLYARVMRSTPGLMHWWRLGTALSTWGPYSTSNDPYYPNAAGPTTLWSNGSVTPATGLLTGDADGAAHLTGGYLEAFDYRVYSTGEEVMSAECWVNLATLKTDTALMGEWESSIGWMLYANGADLSLYAGSDHFTATGALSTSTTLHVVGVWGGQQGPVPDYYSRLYINGVDIASDLLVTSNSLNNANSRFLIGQYADGAGTHALDGTVDEPAVYSRMLQPDEVYQHYQAGLGVLWP